MRLLISILLIATALTGCMHPMGADHSEKPAYQPRPTVSLSTFNTGDHIISVYVRHSKGSVLMHIAPHERSECKPDRAQQVGVEGDFGMPESELKMILTMLWPGPMEFKRIPYENFESSLDVFEDGRIILVPLSDADGGALGAFVNLMSGQRYFFAPSVRSPDAVARVRWLKDRWPDITVIVPGDRRAHERVARFPEFLQ